MSDNIDVARKIFINEEGELRSGFRVFAFIISFLLAAILFNGLLEGAATLFPPLRYLLRRPEFDEGDSARVFLYYGLGQLTNLAAALAASALCARFLERRGLASVGYKLHKGWLRDFALGSALGAGSIALAVGLAAAAGAITFASQAKDAKTLLRAFAFLFLFFLIAAAVEELLFRGFVFQALLHNNGKIIALAVTSILFGIAHIDNTNASLFSVLNTMLAGLWLGLSYLMTRSLWFATALHYSWNITMQFFFGLPVSGITQFNELTCVKGQPGSPGWLSGGDYGPEAGAAATVALIVSTLIVWKSGLFKPTSDMLDALRHGKRQPRFVSIAPVKEETDKDRPA